MTAARAYKDVIASVTAGLEAGADRNAERVAELRRSVESLHKELREASDRHIITRLTGELAWDNALDVLWGETWMTMRPFPAPRPLAKASDITVAALTALNLAVEERSAALRDAVQGRRLRRAGG